MIQKIGIKSGHRIILHNQPEGFLKELGKLPPGVEVSKRRAVNINVAVCFTDTLADLQKNFPVLAGKLAADGMLWIGWPKKASRRPTDLTENVVRKVGLECGLVDVKVCAVDETWSGLKFVIRKGNRPAASPNIPASKKKAQAAVCK